MNPDIESKTLITKLDINDQSAYMKILWKNNETDVFRMKLYEEDRSWSGRFSTEFAEKYREAFDESESEYLNNVKESLARNSDEFVYSFSRNSNDLDSATFVWKKKFKGSTATRVHGSVSLKLDPTPESKDNLIDYLLTQNKELHQTISDINKKINILTEELDKCKQEMEKYVDVKTSLESALYGKFVQILNCKKRRIQLLEDNLQKFSKLKDD